MAFEIYWAILYFALASSITALALHLLYRNWGYIWKYRVTKWFTIIAVPICAISALSFYIQAFQIFISDEIYQGFFYRFNQILAMVMLSLFAFTVITLFIVVGENWLMRMRHRWNRYFGPFLLFGEDPSTQMIIAWGNGLRAAAYPDYPMEFEDQIAQLIKIGTDETNLVNKLCKLHITPRICYIELKDLQPDTHYYYRIPRRFVFTFFGDPYFTRDRRIFCFKTALPKGSNNKFEFVAVSDMHASGAPIQETVKIIKRLTGHHHDVQFIVSSGDNVSDARILTHWRTFFGQLGSVTPFLPFQAIPGNHDGELPKSAKEWGELFPYKYPNKEFGYFYHFYYGNIVFFMMDIYNAGKQTRIPNEKQIEWLRARLEEVPESVIHRVLVMHNAIYTTGDFGCDPDLEKIFLELIDKYKIKLVLTGHSHLFEAFFNPDINKPHGTAFIVNGGGGGRCDYNVLRWYSSTPYRWHGRVVVAKENMPEGRYPEDRFRNDEAVKRYQEFGKLTHELLYIKVDGHKLHIQAIEWGGRIIYERKFE